MAEGKILKSLESWFLGNEYLLAITVVDENNNRCGVPPPMQY